MSSRAGLPGPLVRVLRAGRQGAYVALGPVDYLGRALSGKGDFPPLHLRRHVGPLRSFESSGAEFLAYCRLLAGLWADERVLDVGCGCGLMALFLEEYLSARGAYAGLDLHGPSIRWCRRRFGARPNFSFERMDVRSEAWNPRGRRAPEEYTFPFDDASFDLVLVKSVFTHMRPAGVERYLGELSRLLAPGGRALASFFLLNERQAGLRREGRNRIDFAFGEGAWRHAYRHSPESAAAFDEEYVLGLLAARGLKVGGEVFYGTWSGRGDGLSFQDLLVLEKS